VLGVLPGVIGSLQANEALKLALGIGEPLVGRLLLFDALSAEFNEVEAAPRSRLPGLRRAPDDHGLHRLRRVLRGHAGAGMTKVRIPPTLREQTGGERELAAEGDTVRDLLDDLMSRFPGARGAAAVRERLRRRRGRPHARRARDRVKPGSTVILLPAMAGGV
jgi:molybdopterin converting factor small subunit